MSAPSLKGTSEMNTQTNRFLAAIVTKKLKFIGLDLEICKLSVQDTVEIQNLAEANTTSEDKLANFKLICFVIRCGAKELKDLSDEELMQLPLDDLSRLSNEIMVFSGLAQPDSKK